MSEFECGADWLDRLGTRRLRLKVGVRLDRRTSWSAWLHHSPEVPVRGWPGFLIWRIVSLLSVDVEGWTAVL